MADQVAVLRTVALHVKALVVRMVVSQHVIVLALALVKVIAVANVLLAARLLAFLHV